MLQATLNLGDFHGRGTGFVGVSHPVHRGEPAPSVGAGRSWPRSEGVQFGTVPATDSKYPSQYVNRRKCATRCPTGLALLLRPDL
jgi:hypothetical protein